jgi:4-hydroxybenzoate polyprenyltransferase
MLLIGVCAFVANDLDDIEADCINHPERPLPSKNVSPLFAAGIYFVCLAAALLTTRVFVPSRVAFLYYVTVTLTISYRYVVAFVPNVKALYSAGTIAVPARIVADFNGREPRLYIVVIAVFAFALGRELCMDVVDRAGDRMSLMHRFKPNSIAIFAFLLQTASLLLILVSFSRFDPWAVVDLTALAALLVLAGVYWFRLDRHSTATDVMKLQLLLGLYFLA